MYTKTQAAENYILSKTHYFYCNGSFCHYRKRYLSESIAECDLKDLKVEMLVPVDFLSCDFLLNRTFFQWFRAISN